MIRLLRYCNSVTAHRIAIAIFLLFVLGVILEVVSALRDLPDTIRSNSPIGYPGVGDGEEDVRVQDRGGHRASIASSCACTEEVAGG